MTVNYNVDHTLLSIEPIKSLKGNTKFATWHAMCMIIHFTKVNGNCELPKHQLAKSFGIKSNFFGEATKILIKHNWIKELVPYSREKQTAAIYTVGIGYTSLGLKLYLSGTKAIPTRGKVKEFLKNSKTDEDVLITSSSVNGENIDYSFID